MGMAMETLHHFALFSITGVDGILSFLQALKWPYQSRNSGLMVERPRWCHTFMVQCLVCVLAPEVEH
jgi:hypothetical protein